MNSRLELPSDPSSPRRARRFVIDALDGVSIDVDRAALLVSELVTNAVLHARTPLEVVVDMNPSSVHISVCDGSLARPTMRHYDRYAATGRGLRLLESLADQWGVDVGQTQKAVWFELAVDAGLRERPRPATSSVRPRRWPFRRRSARTGSKSRGRGDGRTQARWGRVLRPGASR